MPDTGAPWNIPYVAGTDLVRDWPTDSQELAEAIADALDVAGNPGIGSNVVSTTKLDAFSSTTNAFVDVTGLTATITPTSATSKVLVIAQVSSSASSNSVLRLRRDSTDLAVGTDGTTENGYAMGQVNSSTLVTNVVVYLDSPATTSAVTYKIRAWVTSGHTFTLNERQFDGAFGGSSSITAIEVAV